MNPGKHLCTCLFLILLAGCSSDDNQPDQTSNPAPDSDVPENPLPSAPGGDTSAIAGLWDARNGEAGSVDERYVEISTDGVYLEYDFRQDDLADDGNCYLRSAPLTLTPEDPANNAYSLPDDRTFNATSSTDGSILSITFAEQPLQDWTAVSGVSTDDLAGCDNIFE
ncbi:hypothetical protein [Granulosicoccus antarcticus]|uniref:Lipoprotein n=1 Tax=Granulosicoccus antarcticus IMCC3135 TaxID=1192854 RepID=A0A2Z2NRS2_9GAMM|nr:hypothetical protein [Granulosicoccus antarcticus]ASJ71440.1 hypothetical protein IMCC3135_06665 [Granulosicoccus antarcticus IMCC3135]